MTILVTGVAGFIGSQVAKRLLDTHHVVVGIDNLNPYYDVSLKKARLDLLKSPQFSFIQMDLADRDAMRTLFKSNDFTYVVHLAAQAGVRYSLENPDAYVDSNLVGFVNLLEGCRHHPVQHLLFASSSSVYGGNVKQPFDEEDPVDHPISLYAATKKANELMAHSYAHLFNIPITGLRFFTAYGPWGRPDMALFKFTQGILEETPIEVYNEGKMSRDFTYVDDIVEAIARLLEVPPKGDPAWHVNESLSTSFAPYRILNLGNHHPVRLMDFIHTIEKAVGKKAIIHFGPIQPGDVPMTYANTDRISDLIDFKPQTPLEEGIGKFVSWYREYYQV